MVRYATVRLITIVPVTLALMILTFIVTQLLPTNPAVVAAGPLATPEQVAQMEARLGLDKSIPEQLVAFLGRLFTGDLGQSIGTGNAVIEDLVRRLPSTMVLTTSGVLVGFVLAIGLAVVTANRERGVLASVGKTFGGLGSSVPDFVVGPILILLFYVAIPVFPVPIGQGGSGADVPAVTGAALLDAVIAGNGGAIVDALTHLALPSLTLALCYAAPIYRVAVSSIEEISRRRFVDYVILNGGSNKLRWRYVLENAFPPILTMSGLVYGLLIGGAVVVEAIFSWGGIGEYAVESITGNDFFAIQGFVMVTAVLSMLIYLSVDLIHAWLDPRTIKRSAS
ncbi:ABC transporter permease [Nonomuraea cavernae]|uniref:ABC transporter permease n=1 Tax=Nonomuraea cavernae TaxID=2045107 RepID=UPI00340DDA53